MATVSEPPSRRRVTDNTHRFTAVALLLLDVDGVLTDGSIHYDDNGVETKSFNVKDGLGLRLLVRSGIRVGIITGRRSATVERRCRDLGIDTLYQGVSDKAALLDTICSQLNIQPEASAFVGDDLPDLPIMKRVGLSVAVADAHETVADEADLVTTAGGGAGAVREVCEAILKARGLWEPLLQRYRTVP